MDGARSRRQSTARCPPALPQKTLSFKNARRDANWPGCSLARRFGRHYWSWRLGCGWDDRQMRQKACGQRSAGPRATDRVLAIGAPFGPPDSIPCTALSGGALRFRIEHWIRHALRDFDSGFPYSENLPMGMSAESIG